jgi:hypothetical protein
MTGPMTDAGRRLLAWIVDGYGGHRGMSIPVLVAEAAIEAIESGDDEPREDGWFTYHVCGGHARELRLTNATAVCPVCGGWCTTIVSISPEAET